MKIEIFIPKDMVERDVEIEIHLNSDGELENVIVDPDNEYDSDLGISNSLQLRIVKAFLDAITDDDVACLATDGRKFIHPEDIRQILNADGYKYTSQFIGRTMQSIGLIPGRRRRTGIPYYWDENRNLIERIVNEIDLYDETKEWLNECEAISASQTITPIPPSALRADDTNGGMR